ncbi:hypothetical protein N7471_007720 [Penicillium samsonianum]|uniref:uncharacterized protein n=1 Tax=Penicillium samsonianum TaxID=1882272 RepID=UPI0025467A4E|nr:uncharacterized protein N7471_007720 [Penicillium samsonianum]KAJ6132505.1 hypothetical protein N7471_007720 [Penicillium samsonianum]
MPVSIFDPSASNSLPQSAMEANTHAMQAYTLSQISSLDIREIHEISDRNSDDVPTIGVLYQGPGLPIATESKEAA